MFCFVCVWSFVCLKSQLSHIQQYTRDDLVQVCDSKNEIVQNASFHVSNLCFSAGAHWAKHNG